MGSSDKSKKKAICRSHKTEFKQHVYGRERRYERKSLEMFDPCPPEFGCKTNELLKRFLKSMQGYLTSV